MADPTPTIVAPKGDKDYSYLVSPSAVQEQEIIASLKSKFPEVEVKLKQKGRLECGKFPRGKLVEFCTYLRDSLDFEHVTCVAGNDLKRAWEVIYHISSYKNRCMIQIRTELPREDPSVDTISQLWGGADWHERETYDMYGITFNNHPKLERVLTPEGTDFFPFRKDFKLLDHWKIDWENKGKRPKPEPMVSTDTRFGDGNG